ncbi:MAG: hypothetical protein MJZ74_00835 [Muribaculaceae bacterium]|nr:hypothetical protein [Muribaculaceae bacterium]
MSGNTLRSTLWSDQKAVYPMLPMVSPVQQCYHCKGYFLLSEQKEDRLEETNEWGFPCGSSFELGELDYNQLKEAWNYFEENRKLTRDNRKTMLHMLLWAFNDTYTRGENAVGIPEDDQAFFAYIAQEMINLTNDPVFKGELLRELGHFEQAIELLNNITYAHTDVIIVDEDLPCDQTTEEVIYVDEDLSSDQEQNLREIVKKILQHAENGDKRPFIVNKD